MQNIVCADYSDRDASAWADYQRSLAEGIRRMYGASRGALRVLVASAVRDEPTAVAGFEDNLRRLQGSSFADSFHFALFHYDGSNALWAERPWYSDDAGVVVMKRLEPGCKPKFWYQITPEMASQYDYVWLLDGDLRLDLFSWDLYRTLLVALEPLVSQPSVLPHARGERSTLIPLLRMATRRAGMFSVAREVFRSEVQTPVISTRLWRMLHARLRETDHKVDFYIDAFWDVGAVSSHMECGTTGILLVNGSPVRHMNYHDLWKVGHCHKGCGAGRANCRGVTAEELDLLRDGLKDICEFTGNSTYMQRCRESLPCGMGAEARRRHWVEADGGNFSIVEWTGRGNHCEDVPDAELHEHDAVPA